MSFSRPKRIGDINQLKPGQHIYMHKRRFGLVHYEHHGIVMSVDMDRKSFDLMHFLKPSLFQDIRIVRGAIDFVKYSRKGIYIVQYQDGECLSDEEVLKKANECIGDRDFNLFARTSEEKSRYCKTGSYQESTEKLKPVVRYENILGELYEHQRDKVTSIGQLRPGDHLVFLRYKVLYEHHAIIISVCKIELKVRVAHFTKSRKSATKITIREETVDFPKSSNLFKVHYEEDETLEPETVVTAALKLVEQKEYCLFRYNCEHFATMCKTSKQFCEQLRTAKEWAVSAGMQLIPRGVRSTTWIIDDLMGLIGKVLKHSKLVKAGAMTITIVVETAMCIWAIIKVSKLYEKGKISLDLFRAKIATFVASASLSVGGSIGGAVVGSIAGTAVSPGVGTIIGAVVGGLVGGTAGGILPQSVANVVNTVKQNGETDNGQTCHDIEGGQELPIYESDDSDADQKGHLAAPWKRKEQPADLEGIVCECSETNVTAGADKSGDKSLFTSVVIREGQVDKAVQESVR